MNIKTVIILFFLLIGVCGCTSYEDHPKEYIVSNKGLTSAWTANCVAGMLVSNKGINIHDENIFPITCNGTITLTREEKEEYEARNKH
jgi:hypothetical protein